MAEDAQSKTSGQGFIPSPPAPAEKPQPIADKTAVPAAQSGTEKIAATPPSAPAPPGSSVGDQLARIEDKTARIEDKYARSEALLARMDEKIENATTRMNDGARQADLAALRSEVRGIDERVRKVPGAGALFFTGLVTAIVTVALMLAAQRLHLENYIPQRSAPAAQQ